MKHNVEKFDWKGTILQNIPWALFNGLMFVFLNYGITVVNSFESNEIRVIALIGWLFTFMKYISFVGQPILSYKTKEGSLVIKY